GGLADHLGVDVALVRIALVVLALFNGVGILAYLIGWIAIPERSVGEPAPSPVRAESRPGGREPLFWVGLGLLVVGAVALVSGPLAGLGILPPGTARELVIPLVLIGFGLALWRAGGTTAPSPQVSSPQAPAPQPPSFQAASDERTESNVTTQTYAPDGGQHTSGPAGPPPTPPAGGQPGGPASPPPTQPSGSGGSSWTPPPVPERTRSWVTRATLGAAFVAVGLLWTLRLAGVIDLAAGAILSVALLIVGIGLLIGAVVGRARWLILVGALLLPPVLAAQVTPPAFGSLLELRSDGRPAGEIDLAPTELDELDRVYELGAGSIQLDLSELELDGETVTIDVELGVGEIDVTVPDDVEVDVSGRVGIGEVRLLDERQVGGIGVSGTTATLEPDDPEGRIELDLAAGIGEITASTVPTDR
ncbi:MAG: PspC domain-containing protein, partial [Actinomycetota bacterium]